MSKRKKKHHVSVWTLIRRALASYVRALPVIAVVGLIGDFAQHLLAHLTRGQLQREAVGKRTFQGRMVQQARVDKATKQWFVAYGLDSLLANAPPDRINRCHFQFGFKHVHASRHRMFIAHQLGVARRISVVRRVNRRNEIDLVRRDFEAR